MWDERYDTEDYIYGTEPNDFLSSVSGNIPKGKVLCLGEGEGRNAVFLASLGYEVYAVDSSEVGLRKAIKLASLRNVNIRTIHADLREFKIGIDNWDAVISIFCHLSPEIRKPLYGNIFNGLRPGGVFILEAYTAEQLKFNTGGPKSSQMLPDLEELKRELKGLNFVHAEEKIRILKEGNTHSGKSAVVQIVAVKPAV